MSFITGTQAELLYTLPAVVTKNNYTTQAAYTGVAGTNPVCSIPPGWLISTNPNPVGRSLYLMVYGTIANVSAATFAVNLGLDSAAGTIANSLAVNAAYTPTAALTAPWLLEAWYTCTTFTTSSAIFQVNGWVRYESVASGGAPTTTGQVSGFTGTQTGDPRVQQYIELFGTWSVASASNTTSVQQMFLWGLN